MYRKTRRLIQKYSSDFIQTYMDNLSRKFYMTWTAKSTESPCSFWLCWGKPLGDFHQIPGYILFIFVFDMLQLLLHLRLVLGSYRTFLQQISDTQTLTLSLQTCKHDITDRFRKGILIPTHHFLDVGPQKNTYSGISEECTPWKKLT